MLKRIALRLIVSWRRCPSSKVQKLRESCIYTPSCSGYTFIYIKRYGLVPGVWNGLLRIKRCNSTKYEGGKDPVP